MDDLKKTKQDGKLISLTERYEVWYWTRALGVTKDQLKELVNKVGHTASKVRKAIAG